MCPFPSKTAKACFPSWLPDSQRNWVSRLNGSCELPPAHCWSRILSKKTWRLPSLEEVPAVSISILRCELRGTRPKSTFLPASPICRTTFSHREAVHRFLHSHGLKIGAWFHIDQRSAVTENPSRRNRIGHCSITRSLMASQFTAYSSRFGLRKRSPGQRAARRPVVIV